MTKTELFDYFDGKISKTQIKPSDDGFAVYGKWCIVAVEDDGIDLFICNPRDMVKGLGTRKLNNIILALKRQHTGTVRELDGEADTFVRDKAVILDNLVLLGIRKKKVVTNMNPTFSRAS